MFVVVHWTQDFGILFLIQDSSSQPEGVALGNGYNNPDSAGTAIQFKVLNMVQMNRTGFLDTYNNRFNRHPEFIRLYYWVLVRAASAYSFELFWLAFQAVL